ncbi:hypothetical protein GH714_035506 [Hevea brasiliensis]|uniref:Reverse transcriptase RNase H-like domain-containing protein n=1 Tax=Hevea brasiliensis TaxID=3981 RepID=A0A6A6KVH2_HEVBR|nr:hypothetical protein GH714_035506 [Hevea brasiliensis]
MTTTPTLAMPNFNELFIIESDASGDVRTWRPYLLGRKFYIHTDQCSLKHLLEQRIVTPEQQKWVAKLVGYEYEIRYKPGRENNAAGALSRVAGSPCPEALYVSHTSLWDDIKKETLHNPYMQRIG